MVTLELTRAYVIALADPQATLPIAGGKGAALAGLAAAGLPVPGGFHVTTQAYDRFVAENNLRPAIQVALQAVNPSQPSTLETASCTISSLFDLSAMPEEIANQVARAYAGLEGTPAVAVRSSATAEDLPDLSFAGQQETYLNIRGAKAVIAAVKRCWASLWTARAIGYRIQHAIDQDAISLAVVVQVLVDAEASGVLFTANPVNGQRGQAMLTAAWGLGEAVVGGLVTPDTLVIDKATGRVLSRETADKRVMTVQIESGTDERPVPDSIREKPVLDDAQAAELVHYGVAIEALYHCPMDIEWAVDREGLHILQARPITALPEPEPPVPSEWLTPLPGGLYVRGSLIEFIPGPLPPLFGTLGLAAMNAGTRRLFTAITRDAKAWEGNDQVVAINHYAYLCQMGTSRQKWLMSTRVMGLLGWAFRTAEDRWQKEALPRYREVIRRWQAQPLSGLDGQEILRAVRLILDVTIDYYAVLQSGPLVVAGSSEVCFSQVYDRLIRRRGDPEASAFLLGYDSMPIRAEKSLFDLAQWAAVRPELAAYVSGTPAAELAEHLRAADNPTLPREWDEWRQRFQAHLAQYGHTIYDLDFSQPVPADDPAPLLETVQVYLAGQGSNPYARQQAAAGRREQATQLVLERSGRLQRSLFLRTLRWAQEWAPRREDALADMGLGYPLVRNLLGELGRRFTGAGMLAAPADIYWLEEGEVEEAATALDQDHHTRLPAYEETIRQRKAEFQTARRVTPPVVLPQTSRLVKLVPWHGLESGDMLKGFGACGGSVTGTARVLNGPQDFDQLRPGEILVAAITTPAWTPLFARAAAVVTDIGGLLSHSSIVAREYGIPAVLGTGVATRRIRSGQLICVDGSAGLVKLIGGADRNDAAPGDVWALPDPKGLYLRSSLVDLMPAPLSPLFTSLVLPAITGRGLQTVMGEFTHSEVRLPKDYITTINTYAYTSTRMTPAEWWWVITHQIPATPRIMREGARYWREQTQPRYSRALQTLAGPAPASLSAAELIGRINQVVEAIGEYVGALLITTTGASAGSEGLFTRLYEKMIRREGDPPAVVFLMGFNSLPIQAEKSLYDLAQWASAQPDLSAYLSAMPTPVIVNDMEGEAAPQGLGAGLWGDWRQRFGAHLARFGYQLYDLDFARPLPCDDLSPMIEVCKMYLRGEGSSPHERQARLESQRQQAAASTLSRLRGMKRWLFSKALGWAQALAEVRENAIAEIGLGYPLLRCLLAELGRRLQAGGAIARPGDIYWLQAGELAECAKRLEAGQLLPELSLQVQERQAAQEVAQALTPPPVLPPRERYLGIKLSTFTAEAEANQASDILKGVGTSAGQVTAPARVLQGPQDFDAMRPGEVLVAAITTPAWTPLFAMAAGVVTDIGGPLSHGSIVAREYGIPAVMGTGVATKRIHNGQMITVDGTAGQVRLSGQEAGR